VVLDGLFVLGDAGLSESDYRRFVNDLALQAELMGCTVLLLTNSRRRADSPEYTMVDGWIELGWHSEGHRAACSIEVHKLRGSGFLPGRHSLRISTGGIEVFPRLESYLGHQPRIPADGLEGYDVVTASNGLQALEMLPSLRCDLVITDQMMPRMDGLTFLGRLRGDARYRALPVIMISAVPRPPDALGALADAFLGKPFEAPRLLLTIRRLLTEGRGAPAA
jgi:CheY-like chemotaxis protein